MEEGDLMATIAAPLKTACEELRNTNR
jgi:hypothetical protein